MGKAELEVAKLAVKKGKLDANRKHFADKENADKRDMEANAKVNIKKIKESEEKKITMEKETSAKLVKKQSERPKKLAERAKEVRSKEEKHEDIVRQLSHIARKQLDNVTKEQNTIHQKMDENSGLGYEAPPADYNEKGAKKTLQDIDKLKADTKTEEKNDKHQVKEVRRESKRIERDADDAAEEERLRAKERNKKAKAETKEKMEKAKEQTAVLEEKSVPPAAQAAQEALR